MKSDRLTFTEVDDDGAWDSFIERSPQGTVFSRSAYLGSLGAPFHRFVVQDGNCASLAQVAVVEDGEGRPIRFPFTPYQGILFTDACAARPRQRVLNEFRLTRFIIEQLTARYDRFEMALSWAFEDLRPFLWHNYGIAGARMFGVTPRYTALLDLRAVDIEAYPAEVRACRRQELKKASGHEVSGTGAIDSFLDLYARTFARQELFVDQDRLGLVRSITATALEQGYGRLSACNTPEGVAAMSLFLYDSKRAYYLLAANDPAQRNSGAATRLMFDNIAQAKRRGLAELDFVGVNSPARGDYKLSFNPQLRLYFDLSYGPAQA